jgi:GT2 family glycosyltransferase
MRIKPEWYVSHNGLVRQALLKEPKLDLSEHFLVIGQFAGADPNPLFLLSHYIAESAYRNRDPGHGPCEDYMRNAGLLQASAHWLFDERWVQGLQPKIQDAIKKRNLISAYLYFLRLKPANNFQPHPLFNGAFYKIMAGLGPEQNAFSHFLEIGQHQGISPHPLFDPEFYVAFNTITGIGQGQEYESPLHHFIARGKSLGLIPIGDFDPDYYAAKNLEVVEASNKGNRADLFDHFLRFGQYEKRAPHEFFSFEDYLWYNPLVLDEIKKYNLCSAFEHFLAFGRKRGLRAHRPLYRVRVPELHAKGIFEQRARIGAQLATQDILEFPEANSPQISLIVPVHDNFIFTMSLLAQLERECRASPAIPTEVLVVDNGSSDQTIGLGELVRGIRVIRTEEAIGYVKACNLGGEEARGELLIFLNNDIELAPGILRRIPKAFRDPKVGVSGARIVNTAGMLQEAGSILWRDGSGMGFGRGQDPTDPLFLSCRDVDYVSGCFLCIRRSLFEQIGGFDGIFSPGYCEDSDLCLQARAHGFRVIYDPALVIFHYEYASYSKGRPPSSSAALMRAKREKLYTKNRSELSVYPGHREVSPAAAAFGDASKHSPRVLFIEDRVPDAISGSGFTTAADILGVMVEAGCLVTVWSVNQRLELDIPHWSIGAWTVLPVIGGHRTVAEHIAESGDNYDVVWVCRTHNFRNLRSALFAWRDAKQGRRIVIDTEALDATRDASMFACLGFNLSAEQIDARIRSELPDLSRADRVVAKNLADAKALSRACSMTPIILGNRFKPIERPAGFEGRSGILFVGALYGEDTSNYDSLRWFIGDVYPTVNKLIPGVGFHIVGYQDKEILTIKSDLEAQIKWCGPAADLRTFFRTNRVFAAPTRYAGGLPHKVENALSQGIPVVCTQLLAQQLEDGTGETYAMVPPDGSPVRFAEAVARLYLDEACWSSYQEKGLQYANRRCDPGRHKSIVLELING